MSSSAAPELDLGPDMPSPMTPEQPSSPPLVALGHAATNAWALLVGIGLLMLGSGLQGSVLGLRATIEGFGTTTTGLIMSSYYLGFLFGSHQAPRLVGSVGHIRVFAAFASIASSAVLLHAILLQPASWVLLRIASGFCMAGLFVVAESWLNDAATNETRGSLLSLYMVVVSGGMAAGQLLLNVADPGGFELFITISVLVSLALVPAALSVRASPRLLTPVPISFATVFRAAPLGLIGVVLTGAASGALFGMGVVVARLSGLTVGQTSVFMLLAILGGGIAQWPVGALSDRIDRRVVIAAVALIAGVISLIGTAVDTSTGLLVLITLLGAASLPLYALLNAHTNDWLTPEQIVGAGSRLVMATGLGAISGPLAASLLMSEFGANGFFAFLAVVHLLLGGYALWRLTRRRAATDDTRSHFAALPARGGSVLLATLNPEVWDEDDHPVFPTEEVPVIDPDAAAGHDPELRDPLLDA